MAFLQNMASFIIFLLLCNVALGGFKIQQTELDLIQDFVRELQIKRTILVSDDLIKHQKSIKSFLGFFPLTVTDVSGMKMILSEEQIRAKTIFVVSSSYYSSNKLWNVFDRLPYVSLLKNA